MNGARALAAALSVLALSVLALSLGATSARADIAPPPVVLHVEGQAASIAAAAPDRAVFEVRNVSDAPVGVFLHRAVVLDGGVRVPLEITRVEVDGRAASRDVRVPAGGSLRVTAYFELPRTMHGRSSYSVELSLRQEGYGTSTSSPAVLTRRGPGKWAGKPARG